MRNHAALHALRRDFSPLGTARKLGLLRSLAARGIHERSWVALAALHDELLYCCAFPDSPAVLRAARRALRHVDAAVRRLPRRERVRGDDSGVAGTTSRYAYEHRMARWIAEVAPREIAVDWAAVEDETPIAGLVAAGVARAEDDALDESDLGPRPWLTAAAHAARTSDAAALLQLEPAGPAAGLWGRMYDAASVPLAWRLTDSRWSTTHNILAPARPAYRTGMRRPPADPVATIAAPLDGCRRARGREAAAVIAAARAGLAARCREVFATASANPNEVWLCPLGEGATLALFGLVPADRVSIEANYGYVLFVNGVPAAYGGVTPLYRQANTGLNIFTPFRGSEGAFLWMQMLRAFRTLFGVTRFVVNAVQFGEDNDEAIASGAYWFYWRLGFRPASARVRALAAREAKRLAARPGTRTSARTLRALAVGDLHLDLPDARAAELFRESWLATLSRRATAVLAAEDVRTRHEAERRVAERVAAQLGATMAGWSAAERDAFVRMAPVIALVPGVARWPASEKRALLAMIRAKGGTHERDFALAAAAHPRFFPALIASLRKGR